MGSCVSKASKTVKTCPNSSSNVSIRDELVSWLISLQHLSNSCSSEIEESIFSNNSSFLVLLKQKQQLVKSTQNSIQALISKLDELIESDSKPLKDSKSLKSSKNLNGSKQKNGSNPSKPLKELINSCQILIKTLKTSPVFEGNLGKLKTCPEMQERLKKHLIFSTSELKEIEQQALNELKDHQMKVKSGGLIRRKYKGNNIC